MVQKYANSISDWIAQGGHAIHEPEMLSDLLSLRRCEDVGLPEDHRKGVLQSKEIVEYNIAMQLC